MLIKVRSFTDRRASVFNDSFENITYSRSHFYSDWLPVTAINGSKKDDSLNTVKRKAQANWSVTSIEFPLNVKKTIAVIDATFAVAKRKPEKNSGFYVIRTLDLCNASAVSALTNWANKPTGSWSLSRFLISTWRMKMKCLWIYEYHILELWDEELNVKKTIAIRDATFAVAKRKPEKKFPLPHNTD